jgi:hypothetical protein
MLLGGYVAYDKLLPRYRAQSAGAVQMETVTEKKPLTPADPERIDLRKYLEITGIRVTEEGRKPQIKFAVVSHAAAELTDIDVKVRVFTQEGDGAGRTFTEIGVKIPALEPYEVRDVTETFATQLRAYEFPDWQYLRAEISEQN